MQDFGLPCSGPTTMWCDNTSSVSLADHDGRFDHTKFWDLSLRVLRDYQDRRFIVLRWVPTVRQLADCLTKNLFPAQFLPAVSRIFGADVASL